MFSDFYYIKFLETALALAMVLPSGSIDMRLYISTKLTIKSELGNRFLLPLIIRDTFYNYSQKHIKFDDEIITC